MATPEQVVENDTPSFMIQQLGKALNDLEACKNASEEMVPWMEIELHFRNFDTMLKKKIEELESREKEYEEKEAKTRALLAEREAEVVAKEQDLLDRVQEIKDAAVAVIVEAQAKHQPALESIDGGDNKDSKVSSSLGDPNSPHKTVKPPPELTQFCEQMDAKGLLSFTLEKQKNLYAIRKELSVALESATEPARLVLNSLEGFYPLVETTQTMDRRDAALQGKRKFCVIFMEAMAALVARVDPGADHLLNPEIKQQAKAIADEWKPMLASPGTDATNGNSLEAHAFLQLLSTFRIASEFDEEELCKLVLVVAHRRQAPELCRSLGLTHKMPGVIESLVLNRKQIDAIHFIHAFQLIESYPPVPLLKAYLDDFWRNSQGKSGILGGTAGSQSDVVQEEITALKAVIGCVEEFNLEDDYPLAPLKVKVAQLEKLKSERKRTRGFDKHQRPNKPRANGGYRGFHGRANTGTFSGWQAPPVVAERAAYTGTTERYPHAGINPYDYQAPSLAAYGQPVPDQRRQYYSKDDRVAATIYNATPDYSGYLDTGMQPSSQ